MLEAQSASSFETAVFLDTVEEARHYTKILLTEAAADYQRFASQPVVSPRTGRSYSGRVSYGEREFHVDRYPLSSTGQYLLMGTAALGEVRALQTLALIKKELKVFFTNSAPASAVECHGRDGFTVELKNGRLRVSIQHTLGECMLAVVS